MEKLELNLSFSHNCIKKIHVLFCIEIVSGNVDFFFSARFTSEKNELINFSSHNLSVKDNHLNVCHFKNSTIGFVVSLSFWIFSQSVDAKIFFFQKSGKILPKKMKDTVTFVSMFEALVKNSN